MKTSLALLGASAMLLSIAPVAALAQAPAAKTLEALTLSDSKISDSVEISALWAKQVGKADHVLVTTDAVFADSLASGALQGNLNAPLLFVDSKAGLDPQTTKTITELGASKVTILGGASAVPSSLVSALEKVPGVKTVDRIAGESRVETSVAIAKKIGAKDATVIVARADDYADSLAAGALAAHTGYPVLLSTNPYKGTGTDGKETMVAVHPALESYLKDAGIKKVLVAGGPSAVADDTVKAIKNLVNDTTRVAGETRRETAVALAKLWNGQGKAVVIDGFAETNGFQNGFAAALSAAKLGAPVILTNKASELSSAEKALIGPNATGVTGYCGTYVDAGICKQVAVAQGAVVKEVKLVEGDALLPLKTTPTDEVNLTANAKQPATRAYEVANAQANVDYTLTLAKAKKDEKGNVVLDLGTDGKPQPSTAKVGLGVVNGAVITDPNPLTTTVLKAVDGRITFAIEAKDPNAFGLVIPVITVKDGDKDKIVGQGGAVSIWPEEMPDGYFSATGSGEWTVAAVDKGKKVAVVTHNDKVRTLRLKALDEVFTGTAQANERIAFEDLLKYLSVGDFFSGDGTNAHLVDSIYYRSNTIASRFIFVNRTPAAVVTSASQKMSPTEKTITLSLGGVEPGAAVVVKIAAVPDMKGLDYKAAEDRFTLERTFNNLQPDANKVVEVTLTGLDPDTKYDFAVAQTVNGETTAFEDFGETGDMGTEGQDWIATTKTPVPVAIASIERETDKINDGQSTQPEGEQRLNLTLSNDLFNGATVTGKTIDLSKIKVIAATGGVVHVGQATVVDRVLQLTLNTGLQDVTPDVRYTVKIDQGALLMPEAKDNHPVGSPNVGAEISFNYR